MGNVMDVILILEKEYNNMGCALNYSSPFELLVATMLSAQTTDVNVNKTTSVLFTLYKTPKDFALIQEEELQNLVKSCGFYKVKSKNIINTSKIINEKYNGIVPDNLDELVTLPGVGRKTANVVISNAFGKDAIAVDTHVFRVSNRIGIANANNVEDTEIQLMQAIPREYWSRTHHWLIWHGRKVCIARKPKCNECKLSSLCLFFSIHGK